MSIERVGRIPTDRLTGTQHDLAYLRPHCQSYIQYPRASASCKDLYDQLARKHPGPGEPADRDEIYSHEESDENLFRGEQELASDEVLDDATDSNEVEREIPRETPSQTFSGETLRPSKSGPWEQSLHGSQTSRISSPQIDTTYDRRSRATGF